MKNRHVIALCAGFALDALLGDPPNIPHPVRAIGKLIEVEESILRDALPKTPEGERLGGALMIIDVVGAPTIASALSLHLLEKVHPVAALAAESIMCYQLIAARSLRDESMKVHAALEEGSLDGARTAVSMIVGRDTAALDEAGVTRAAVETVAESTSDGIVAPLFYMALGGAPAGWAYKAINTMDSMVGYKNDRYINFGSVPARLDDLVNIVPARIAGVLMCAAAHIAGPEFDGQRAWSIFKRDRRNHTSPNAAHTEAAAAGALGVRLGGGNYYFGKYVEKPTMGDNTRQIEKEDIVRANKLMYTTAALAVGGATALGLLVGFVRGRA